MKQSLQCSVWRPSPLLAFAGVMSLLVFTGVGCSAGAGSGIPNVSQSAEELPPGAVYSGPQMDTPRYAHSQTRLIDGRVIVVGGSDERLLTSIDSAEIFDQSIFVDPAPESVGGGFISTDFNGDPIVMGNQGRLFHTATLLPSGNLLIAGGSTDSLASASTETAEIFDVPTREFAPDFLAIANEMIMPRFRHTATVLPSGDVLIVGGQITVDTTIIDTNFAPGQPQFQQDVRSFPSTDVVELFRSSAREFEIARDINGIAAELVTPRGRTGHGSVTIAGPDLNLNTADDYVIFSGGWQTLSSIFAPLTKFRTSAGLGIDMQTSMEVFNPTTGVIRAIADIETIERAGFPSMINLGTFRKSSFRTENPLTPGANLMVPGLNNMFIITNGDSNGAIQAVPGINSTPRHDVLSTVFTGAGPNDGILVGLVQAAAGGPRSEVNSVLMPCQRTFDGQSVSSNWVFSTLGFTLFQRMVQLETEDGTTFITMFDPLYNSGEQIPISTSGFPWDQSGGVNIITGGVGNQELNPTGVVGAYHFYSGFNGASTVLNETPPDPPIMPGSGNLVFGGATAAEAVAFQFSRTDVRISTVAGVDGTINTFDDRIVAIGGGSSWLDSGGEPVSTSSEIFVPFSTH